MSFYKREVVRFPICFNFLVHHHLTVLGKCFTICNSQDEINFKNSNFSSLDASSEGSLVNPEIKGCPWMDCN